MNFVQILATCDDLKTIVGLVHFIVNLICWAIPIILIVLITLDVAKVATAGNLDDKMKKEVGSKVVTRLIYAVVIFLIPMIITILFDLFGSKVPAIKSDGTIDGCTWSQVWG